MHAYLAKLLDNDRVPHLMLFSGPTDAGMDLIAFEFAKTWLKKISRKELKQFSDLHLLKAEGKTAMHGIASIRDLIEKASLAPFEAAGKAFIIDRADRMLPTCANALLKTIEEPSPHTLIILTTSAQEAILPTIRSRCQLMRFKGKNTEKKDRELRYPQLERLKVDSLHFIEMADLCDEFHKIFEERKKFLEKEMKAHTSEHLKEMNATQRQKIEDEVEGAVASKWQQEVQELLIDIGLIYRDLGRPSLEVVQEAQSFAKLAIERSTPLKNALESFLLRMHR